MCGEEESVNFHLYGNISVKCLCILYSCSFFSFPVYLLGRDQSYSSPSCGSLLRSPQSLWLGRVTARQVSPGWQEPRSSHQGQLLPRALGSVLSPLQFLLLPVNAAIQRVNHLCCTMLLLMH